MSRSSGYADDVIGHCESEAQAQQLLAALVVRLSTCKLELHPQKTKIVYCKDANRRGDYPVCSTPQVSRHSDSAYFLRSLKQFH